MVALALAHCNTSTSLSLLFGTYIFFQASPCIFFSLLFGKMRSTIHRSIFHLSTHLILCVWCGQRHLFVLTHMYVWCGQRHLFVCDTHLITRHLFDCTRVYCNVDRTITLSHCQMSQCRLYFNCRSLAKFPILRVPQSPHSRAPEQSKSRASPSSSV